MSQALETTVQAVKPELSSVNNSTNKTVTDNGEHNIITSTSNPGSQDTVVESDPYLLRNRKKENITTEEIHQSHPQGKSQKVKKVKKYYNRQNELIDAYLGSVNEEQAEIEDTKQFGGKVRFAVNASFTVNFCLFIIQMYAAVSTGSLSLFATAADAFMDLVSSIVMMITSRLAARPNLNKYPVGRKRVETVGIILFCCLMTTVSIELIIESARRLADGKPATPDPLHIIPLVFVGVAIFSKGTLFVYCFLLRRYPTAHIFMIDHRNDIVVNIFGLIMSIISTKYNNVWFLDPTGAICIACLILFSWATTAFEHMWLLVGKTAPQEFLNKLVYVSITHDPRIKKIETARAYTAGEKYYVEVDVIMDQGETLKITHDVSQTLQRKLEGLSDVERAFVHVDYDDEHSIGEEHKPLYEIEAPKGPLVERFKGRFKFLKRAGREDAVVG